MKRFLKFILVFCIFINSGCNSSSYDQSNQPPVSQISTATNESTDDITIDGESLFFNEYNEAIKQRDISKDVEFVPINKTTNVCYGNLPQNFTSLTLPGLVCPDIENDILYFTNLSDKETLCKLENGKITEVLPLTAKSINLWDGYLYYICNSNDMVGIPKYNNEFRVGYTGDIYRYNIETGENELLIDTDAYVLIVSDYGLDYSAGQNYSYEKQAFESDIRYYHADFDGSNIEENQTYPIIDNILGVYYGENKLEVIDGAVVFHNLNNNIITPILSRHETCDCAAIVDNTLYYGPNLKNYRLNSKDNIVSRNEVCGINLITGKIISTGDMGYMTDYAIINSNIIVCNGLNFSVVNDSGKTSLSLELHGYNDGRHEFIALYTDGKSLYAADDRKGIYIIEENSYSNGLIYYEIGGTPWESTDIN